MKGYGISLGLASEKVFVLDRNEYQKVCSDKKISKNEIVDKIKHSLFYAAEEYVSLRNSLISKISDHELEILEFYIEILQEPEFINLVIDLMIQNGILPYEAVMQVYDKMDNRPVPCENHVLNCTNAEIKSLALLVSNIYDRIESNILPGGEEKYIIVGDYLPFYIFSSIDTNRIAGVITENGTASSHSAVLLRSLNIPAVFGVEHILEQVKTGDWVMIDGDSGEIQLLDNKINHFEMPQTDSVQQNVKNCVSKDGKLIKLMGNVSSIQEAESISKFSKFGAGLIRTEFLFMDNTDIPTYYRQISKYLQIKKCCASETIIFRLFDITPEKETLLGERNLDKYCLIESQIRALLKVFDNEMLYLLIPNVRSKDEILAVNDMIIKIKDQFINNKLSYSKKIRIGIMVETTDIVKDLDDIMEIIDFAAIGTNDLSADFFGYDRCKEQHTLFFYEPKFLNYIKEVIDQFKKHHKLIYSCGAMSRTREGALTLCALGLDTLSMSPSSIPAINKFLSGIDLTRAKKQVEDLLLCDNAEEVMDRLIDLIYN